MELVYFWEALILLGVFKFKSWSLLHIWCLSKRPRGLPPLRKTTKVFPAMRACFAIAVSWLGLIQLQSVQKYPTQHCKKQQRISTFSLFDFFQWDSRGLYSAGRNKIHGSRLHSGVENLYYTRIIYWDDGGGGGEWRPFTIKRFCFMFVGALCVCNMH